MSPLNLAGSAAAASRMDGGDFQVNMEGLHHYRRFGYKGRMAASDDIAADSSSADWITVRYKCNRGIFHDGDFPHQSTPVSSLPLDSTGIGSTVRRVILGLNCFTQEVAECCARAPEHSDAFNRTVKLYQAMSCAELSVSLNVSSQEPDTAQASDAMNGSSKKGMTAKELLRNPALAKLVVLAARRVKANASINVKDEK